MPLPSLSSLVLSTPSSKTGLQAQLLMKSWLRRLDFLTWLRICIHKLQSVGQEGKVLSGMRHGQPWEGLESQNSSLGSYASRYPGGRHLTPAPDLSPTAVFVLHFPCIHTFHRDELCYQRCYTTGLTQPLGTSIRMHSLRQRLSTLSDSRGSRVPVTCSFSKTFQLNL